MNLSARSAERCSLLRKVHKFFSLDVAIFPNGHFQVPVDNWRQTAFRQAPVAKF